MSRGFIEDPTRAPGGACIRPMDPSSEEELELVARRMRETLEEVLGPERGRALYTMDWLRDRVRWHLDRSVRTAEVFLSIDGEGRAVGHTIVRAERDDADATEFGLFSTTFVEPGSRRRGVATALLRRGEAWMLERGLARAVTYTAVSNAKLIGLYARLGYDIVETKSEMVKLSKALRAPPGGSAGR